jgi:hypothetical protein
VLKLINFKVSEVNLCIAAMQICPTFQICPFLYEIITGILFCFSIKLFDKKSVTTEKTSLTLEKTEERFGTTESITGEIIRRNR